MAGISPSTSSGPYTANGVQTAFQFDFTANSGDEVSVEVDGTEVSSSLYTVAIDSDYNGGTVTFLTAPEDAAVVTIFADPDFLQASEFESEGAYRLATVNTINRRAAVRDLWLKARALLFSPSGIADATNRAGKFLGWGGGGDPVFLSGTGADSALRTDLAASGGSALAGFLQSGTGAVARSLQTKGRDTVSVKDFGAVGDGTNDYTYLTASRDAARVAKATLHFPSTTTSYAFGTTLAFGDPYDGVSCDVGTTLKYTGASGSAILLDGSADLPNGAVGASFGWGDTPRIESGGANGVSVKWWNQSRLDVEITKATSVGVVVDFAVLTDFRVIGSTNRGPDGSHLYTQAALPPILLQIADSDTVGGFVTTSCNFTVIAEGLEGTGIDNQTGQYCSFYGTSEGNGGSGYVEGASGIANRITLFCEANTGYDYNLGGSASVLTGCIGSSTAGSLVTGSDNIIQQSILSKLTIDATGRGTVLRDAAIVMTGGLVDNGPTTVYEHVGINTSYGRRAIPDKRPRPKIKRIGTMAITGVTLTTTGSGVKSVLVTIANHQLDFGERIAIASVGGTTQLNGNTYRVEPVDANTVYLLADNASPYAAATYINGNAFSAYTSGGTATFGAFTNSWANYGSGFRTVGFYRTAEGMVRLTGSLTGGTGSAFTLPAGYRPSLDLGFAVVNPADGTIKTVVIDETGTVSPSGQCCLDGVSFLAEA